MLQFTNRGPFDFCELLFGLTPTGNRLIYKARLSIFLDAGTRPGDETKDRFEDSEDSAQVREMIQGACGRSLKFLAPGFFAVLLLCPVVAAQAGPEGGGHEIEFWTGGGHGLNGRTSDTGVFNVGVRYGWILTTPHGPGFLRGQFEYAVDAVPVFLVVQRTGTAYGAGVNPFALKWNFRAPRRVVPYLEVGGGTLFTTSDVPPGTSRINFTSGGAFGLHFLQSKYNWSAEVRYMHISNAGLANHNPGINTIQMRLGFGWFSHSK